MIDTWRANHFNGGDKSAISEHVPRPCLDRLLQCLPYTHHCRTLLVSRARPPRTSHRLHTCAVALDDELTHILLKNRKNLLVRPASARRHGQSLGGKGEGAWCEMMWRVVTCNVYLIIHVLGVTDSRSTCQLCVFCISTLSFTIQCGRSVIGLMCWQ